MNPGFGLAPNEARVLTALVRVETPVTGRAVARITGMTQSTAQRTLARLREAGFVVAEPAPPSLLYRVNTDHLAMPAMLALLRIGDELRNRMAERIAQWPVRPVSVVIYGSVARGDATTGSEMDVLVVRSDATEPDDPTWQHQLAELADRVYRWTGKRASVIDMRRREAVEGLGDQEPFLVEAGRDGWLVAGQALGELAGDQD